jgi:MerR family transcriptional regulator, light-induced transcriptional regulator
VTADAAAALIGTSPTILALWEKRFGYPVPERTDDGQRLYADDAMIALRDALNCQLSIPAAISRARGIPMRSTP